MVEYPGVGQVLLLSAGEKTAQGIEPVLYLLSKRGPVVSTQPRSGVKVGFILPTQRISRN
jgi:hypothetical protein